MFSKKVDNTKAAHEKVEAFLSFMPDADAAEHMADVAARTGAMGDVDGRCTFACEVEGQIVAMVSCTLNAPAESYRKYFDCDTLINLAAHEGETYLQLDNMMINPIFYSRIHEIYRMLILATQRAKSYSMWIEIEASSLGASSFFGA